MTCSLKFAGATCPGLLSKGQAAKVTTSTKGLRAQAKIKSGSVLDRLTRWCCELTRLTPSGAEPFAAQVSGQRKHKAMTAHHGSDGEKRTPKVAFLLKPAEKKALTTAATAGAFVEKLMEETGFEDAAEMHNLASLYEAIATRLRFISELPPEGNTEP